MQTLEYWQKIAPKLKTILKFCEFFFWIFCEFFSLQSNVGEFLQKEKASKIFYFLSTVGRRLPRCRQMCPSNMIIVIRTCGWWWSRGGRLRLIRSHHISWQVLGNLAVVCSMCSIWCFRKLPPIDPWMGWTDGVTNFFATHTPPWIIVLGTCHIGPFFCSPPPHPRSLDKQPCN